MKAALDAVRAGVDLRARRDADPISFVHRQKTKEDRELVALLSASCALGNVKAIRMKLEEALRRIARVDPSVARAADDAEELHACLRGFKHRLFKGEDIARLLIGARKVQRSNGSLVQAFEKERARGRRTLPRGDAEAHVREALAS